MNDQTLKGEKKGVIEMKNLITKIMVAVFLTLAIPVFALAAGLPPLNTNVVFRPISPDLKLKAVNNMLKSLNMPPAPSVPPAKVVLTPSVPVVNKNFLVLNGYYSPKDNKMSVRFAQDQMIRYVFETVPGKTYLLDISVDANSRWKIKTPSSWMTNVIDQQGHLLIPFIAPPNNSFFQLQLNAPYLGGSCNIGSAELTQIN